MAAAVIKASERFLADLLKLPPWMKIIQANISLDGRTITLTVAGPYCPQPDEDGCLREVTPVYQRNDAGEIVLIEVQGVDT